MKTTPNQIWREIDLYPFIFAIFPILSLYVHNIDQLRFQEVIGSILFTSILVGLLWLGLVTVLQSGNKASILVAIFFMMFFSYGHFIRSVAYVFSLSGRLEQAKSLLQGRFADSFWLLFWMAIFTVITLLILKNRGKSINLRKLFQFISIGALITVAFNWFSYVVREPNNEVNLFIKDWQAETSSEVPQNIRQDEHFDNQKLPDIYYIVLDGLGRADTLKEYYGADLTPFITFLRNKGFYIADKSRSNYAWTELSLASSLNLEYINGLQQTLGAEASNTRPLEDIVEHNRISQYLRAYGYKTLTFHDEYELTHITSSDIYLSPNKYARNAFQNELINTTPLPAFYRLLSLQSPYEAHRQHLLFMFEHLKDAINNPEPNLVFAHFMAPHPPFVFGENGEAVSPNRNFSFNDGAAFLAEGNLDEYIQGYRSQVAFLTARLQTELENIFRVSTRPVIVIIQGDHGPGAMLDWASLENTNLKDRFSIFNAYYFPDQNYTSISQDVTPVNTFRIVIDQYFEGNFEPLEDKQYFTLVNRPYNFIDVTEMIRD